MRTPLQSCGVSLGHEQTAVANGQGEARRAAHCFDGRRRRCSLGRAGNPQLAPVVRKRDLPWVHDSRRKVAAMANARLRGGVPALSAIIDRLALFHGDQPGLPSTDPFELILLENVAYLASDNRRAEALDHLRNAVGTQPEAILRASHAALEAVTSGILKGTSATKLRRCAEIAVGVFEGDIAGIMSKPSQAAKRDLQQFPGVGEPAAEKILLFAAGEPFLAPDSNGLRVLVRLGIIEEAKAYSSTYARARIAAAALGPDPGKLQAAHCLLRVHGRQLCKRSRPRCGACPLVADCVHGRAHQAD